MTIRYFCWWATKLFFVAFTIIVVRIQLQSNISHFIAGAFLLYQYIIHRFILLKIIVMVTQ